MWTEYGDLTMSNWSLNYKISLLSSVNVCPVAGAQINKDIYLCLLSDFYGRQLLFEEWNLEFFALG